MVINWSNIIKTYDIQELQEKYEHWHELHEQIKGTQGKWVGANTLLYTEDGFRWWRQ